jgi:hypothetical protein
MVVFYRGMDTLFVMIVLMMGIPQLGWNCAAAFSDAVGSILWLGWAFAFHAYIVAFQMRTMTDAV